MNRFLKFGFGHRAGRALFFSLIVCLLLSIHITNPTTASAQDKWEQLLDKYADNEDVDSLIFVKYKGGSRAVLTMNVKDEAGEWERIINCKAYVGKNGIGKTVEGDVKTPTGTFTPTIAFGIKKDPGAILPYTKLNKYLYWSGNKRNYNKMVDIRKQPDVVGEHLIKYRPNYNYALDMGYNKKCVYGKGSALFMHCFGKNKYTHGCVAVSKNNMIKILKTTSTGTRICIYRK